LITIIYLNFVVRASCPLELYKLNTQQLTSPKIRDSFREGFVNRLSKLRPKGSLSLALTRLTIGLVEVLLIFH
jgi:hypothetical protein